MARAGKKQLRALWLQVHKWIGLTLAVLIIPIALTGSALVWHDWLDAKLEPQRHAVLGAAALAPSVYAAAARSALQPGEALSALRFDKDGGPVVGTAVTPAEGGGRPVRTSLWLDPRDAALIDRASGNSGAVQVMHVLHGSLFVPGWGRTIVGWVGVFMLVSCLSGIWLWWPLSGNVASGFRWKRRNTLNANLHYMTGFWILFPLARSISEASRGSSHSDARTGRPPPAAALMAMAMTGDPSLVKRNSDSFSPGRKFLRAAVS